MPPRIVFFMSDLEVGGLQRHAIDLTEQLRQRGWFARIVVSRDNISPNLTTHMSPADYILLRETRRMLDPRSWPRQWQTVSQLRPDIVVGVGQMPINLLAIWKSLGRLDAKLACTFGTTIPRPRDWTRRPLFSWALKRTDSLIYCSKLQADFWKHKGIGSKKDVVIYNGVDTSWFRPATAEERLRARQLVGLSHDDLVFGLVGAFRPEKNHMQLVRAVERLRAIGIPAKAVFIGNGATRRAVEENVNALGLSNDVIFAGEHSDVRPFISAFDAGVLCSVAVETFSIAALELMASGVPMVHSRLGGATEMIDDGVDGLLFDIGDTDQLVESLKHFNSPLYRETMSKRARDKVIRLFGLDGMVSQYIDLFQTIRHPD
jgi:glycosyltransferase involved in cell wall biosynthesis